MQYTKEQVQWADKVLNSGDPPTHSRMFKAHSIIAWWLNSTQQSSNEAELERVIDLVDHHRREASYHAAVG